MHGGLINTLGTTIKRDGTSRRLGFTLIEVLAALAILAFVSTSVLVVIDRCIEATADSTLQMEAFNLVREHMETLLASESVTENVDFGTSERYPDMSWRAATEVFSESTTGQMWIRAVCSAEYTDSKDQEQTVELVHWVAMLSDKQAEQLTDGEDLEALAAEQLIEDIETAAEYAGVEPATIEQWMENGLLTTSDGAFIQYNLDIFISSNGEPTEEQQDQQVESIEDLAMILAAQGQGAGTEDDTSKSEEAQEGR